jgi:hypothetical protein
MCPKARRAGPSLQLINAIIMRREFALPIFFTLHLTGGALSVKNIKTI